MRPGALKMAGKTINPHRHPRDRGAAALLAMMFLVIFSSLAAAMAIVSQGNLNTADSSLKINRSLAAAETGMQFMMYRVNQVTSGGPAGIPLDGVSTRLGVIDSALATTLWQETRTELLALLTNDVQYADNLPSVTLDGGLFVPYVTVGPGQPQFSTTFTPHPIAGEDYDDMSYQQSPYSDMNPPTSSANPLDERWIRMKITAKDGPDGREVYRSITMDLLIDKKIKFALLSKSRVMIGRNVMIDGPIGSGFTETNLEHGHPIQMVSDFRGLDPALDTELDTLIGTLVSNDQDGDNRIRLANATETSGIINPAQYDLNADGYIDDYDYFMGFFDADANGQISLVELDPTSTDISRQQLMTLIDTFGLPTRPGYGDGFIDEADNYAKLSGEIILTADKASWNTGAAVFNDPLKSYQDFLQGAIHPNFGEDPLTFAADPSELHEFSPSDFDVASFALLAVNSLPAPNGGTTTEEVPFGAAHPYDYYDRPVYDSLTFENLTIPPGTNALFRNCTFVGVTYVDTATDNIDPDFNYAGMVEADGTPKHPNRSALVNGIVVADTKTVANSIRFDNCTFNGAVVTQSPNEFTHVRNKLSFTGTTRFILQNPLSADEIELFRRSTLLAPHFSVEMGTFIAPEDAGETIELSGTIVAGVLDMRGQVKVVGSIVTTFEPISNTGPVIGDTSPQFNTTLGYFSSSEGDFEAEAPNSGVGVIQVRYDPTLPMPDGILANIELSPVLATYREGGQ